MSDTVTRPAARPFTVRAAELQRLVAECATARADSDENALLRTRAGELERLARRASELAMALALLDALEGVAPIAREHIGDARAKLQRLQARIDESGVTPLFAKRALESSGVEEALQTLENRAQSAWRGYVRTGLETGGLETILARYAGYRAAALPIAEKRAQLEDCAKRLPMDAEAVRTVERLRHEFGAAVERAVTEQGFSERVVEFLSRAVSGVPLSDVLHDAEVLAWLRDRDHATAFKLLPK